VFRRDGMLLAVGPHTVDARLDGHEPASASAVLTRGEEQRVQLRLEPQVPLFASPWFWTIVGFVHVNAEASAPDMPANRTRSIGRLPLLTITMLSVREPHSGMIP
jgi:hypothetical protein